MFFDLINLGAKVIEDIESVFSQRVILKTMKTKDLIHFLQA